MKIFLGKPMTCNLNYQPNYIYDELNEKFDITTNPEEADIIVFPGTCSCTEEDIYNTINIIKSIIKRKKEGAKTYLTGCLSRKYTKKELEWVEEWLNENIDYIIPQNKPNMLLKMIGKKIYEELEDDYFGGFFMDYQKGIGEIYLSSGCLNNCSFCKKTYQELPLKSTDYNNLKDIIEMYSEIGAQKLVLKGTNIAQYGLDINGTYLLKEVIDYIETFDNIERIELIGLGFKDAIKGELSKALSNSSKITDISGGLESGSNRLLNLMNKGFTSEEFINFVEETNIKNSLTLNIIAGFPTETIEDIELTIELLQRIKQYIKNVDIIRYINSNSIDSNNYAQHERSTIVEHANIYQKELSKRGINSEIPSYC